MILSRRRLALGGAVLAASISACKPDHEAKVPDPMAVWPLIDRLPMGSEEEWNSPYSKYPLKGKIAGCRGRPECAFPLYAGETLMDFKFDALRNGHAEIKWVGMRDDWLVFRMRVDFDLKDSVETFQTIPVGESRKLFSTDLVVTPEKTGSGQIFLRVGR